MITAKT